MPQPLMQTYARIAGNSEIGMLSTTKRTLIWNFDAPHSRRAPDKTRLSPLQSRYVIEASTFACRVCLRRRAQLFRRKRSVFSHKNRYLQKYYFFSQQTFCLRRMSCNDE
jgi:hypothetical protein